MALNPDQIEAQLCDYLDGTLDDAARVEIEQYLRANPQHQTLLAQLRRLRQMLGDLPREAAPAELAEAVHQQLERSALLRDEPGPARWRLGPWPQVASIAAVLLLAVGLAAIIYFVALPPRTQPPAVAIVPVRQPGESAATELSETRDATDALRWRGNAQRQGKEMQRLVEPGENGATASSTTAPLPATPAAPLASAVPPSVRGDAEPAIKLDGRAGEAPMAGEAKDENAAGPMAGTADKAADAAANQGKNSHITPTDQAAGEKVIEIAATQPMRAAALAMRWLGERSIRFRFEPGDQPGSLSLHVDALEAAQREQLLALVNPAERPQPDEVGADEPQRLAAQTGNITPHDSQYALNAGGRVMPGQVARNQVTQDQVSPEQATPKQNAGASEASKAPSLTRMRAAPVAEAEKSALRPMPPAPVVGAGGDAGDSANAGGITAAKPAPPTLEETPGAPAAPAAAAVAAAPTSAATASAAPTSTGTASTASAAPVATVAPTSAGTASAASAAPAAALEAGALNPATRPSGAELVTPKMGLTLLFVVAPATLPADTQPITTAPAAGPMPATNP